MDLSISDNPYYALNQYSEYGNIEMVKSLVSQCVGDINEALISSSYGGHLDIVKYLVGLGADIKTNKYKSLRFAAENQHLDVVKFLVKNGADVHSLDGIDALSLYNIRSNWKLIKFLEKQGTVIIKKSKVPQDRD